MNKYKNGKIYKLTNGGLTYYGSTTHTKEERFAYHRLPGNKISSKALFKLGGIVKIDIIEHFPCNSKFELEEREAYYIRSNWDNCVNITIPHRTPREYDLDNRERKLLYKKEYYLDNRERIALYDKGRQEYKKMAKRWKNTEFGKLCKMFSNLY